MYGELPAIKTTNDQSISGFPVVIRSPLKTAVLRLPTNQELTEYLRQQKSIYRDLGRRRGESEPVFNPQADQALFKALCISRTGDEFDEYEALHAIKQLTDSEVLGCVHEGDVYRITLKTPFGPVEHVMGGPSQRDITMYRRHVIREVQLPHGVTERRFPPDAPGTLYDSVVQSTTGYIPSISKTDVPPHHKSAVVYELVQAVSEEADAEASDPN